MTDFSKILEQAKNMSKEFKEKQEKIKQIRVKGFGGSNMVEVTLSGEGNIVNLLISDETMKEEKSIIEDLIKAAFSDAQQKLKLATSEEISKISGLPEGFKFPF